MLDVNNKIWYFGLKQGVGIQAKNDSLCQYEPVRLTAVTTHHYDRDFLFVAAGDQINLALSLDDNVVYSFGKELTKDHPHTANGRVHETHFEKIREKEKAHVASFVSCAKQHYVSISKPDFIPYSWGDNTGFRCG